jgi:hypothetical protein
MPAYLSDAWLFDSHQQIADDFVFAHANFSIDDGPDLHINRFESSDIGYAGAIDTTADMLDPEGSLAIAKTHHHHSGASAATIDHSAKIGIGTWDFDAKGTAFDDLGRFDFNWYYNWQSKPLWTPDGGSATGDGFVPMIWGKGNVTGSDLNAAEASSSKYVLGFNEPDNPDQSDMSVADALNLWPKLMATGKLLGSPAAMTSDTLGADSWLGRFMDGADAKGYDVDFVAVHYYSDDTSVGAFKDFLKEVHAEYDKPVWVTEWALVDWDHPDRFSDQQMSDFVDAATHMMDDLRFVKRQSWFGMYSGGDGWNINSELVDDNGHLTKIGQTFADLTHG